MSRIKIITDSTAYLAKEDIEKYEIAVIPLSVSIADQHFRETEKTQNEFYELLISSKDFPTTSQPSVGDFYQRYQEYLKTHEQIISIHISSGISGTVESASAAAQELDPRNIRIFDSATTVVALKMMVLEAAKMAAQGNSLEQIMYRLEYLKENVKMFFIVNSFEYLIRGGRIGKAAGLVGTILKIKPILFIKGQVAVLDKARTEAKALGRLIKELDNAISTAGGHDKVILKLIYVYNPDVLIKIEEIISRKWPDMKYDIASVGPVVGSHVGPGAYGMAFYPLSNLS